MTTTARPSGYPTWAASATNITEPTDAKKAVGWAIGEKPASSYFNWLENMRDTWQRYLDAIRGNVMFGDGSDGDCVFDGSGTFSGLASGPSGFSYNLIRVPAFRRLAITSGVQLISNGYPIYASDELIATGSGRITANGGPGAIGSGATGGRPGIPSPANVVGGGGTGGKGGNIGTNGTTGCSMTNSYGGYGGGEPIGIASNGGPVTRPAANAGSPHLAGPQFLGHLMGAGVITMYQGGAGGGGGWAALNSSGWAGGGGGGGGVLAIAARKLTLVATALQAFGGDGGSGYNGQLNGGGGGMGGSAGGGGVLELTYVDKPTGVTFLAAINCRGGFGGWSSGGSATMGSSGAPGTVFERSVNF